MVCGRARGAETPPLAWGFLVPLSGKARRMLNSVAALRGHRVDPRVNPGCRWARRRPGGGSRVRGEGLREGTRAQTGLGLV